MLSSFIKGRKIIVSAQENINTHDGRIHKLILNGRTVVSNTTHGVQVLIIQDIYSGEHLINHFCIWSQINDPSKRAALQLSVITDPFFPNLEMLIFSEGGMS